MKTFIDDMMNDELAEKAVCIFCTLLFQHTEIIADMMNDRLQYAKTAYTENET